VTITGGDIRAESAGNPLRMTQKRLGHAQLSTTALYADAVGAEKRAL
jgi:site-specific recombinase XerD